MCPSSKQKFEKEMFIRTANLEKGATPIAICITGAWVLKHHKEFKWLIKQDKEKKLDITWVNHSWNHVYKRKTSYKNNFLLIKGTNFDMEVCSTEVMLLEHGITPSIFFRFPGLVSNKKTINRLRELTLIPLGADAWLNIGQKPKLGSVILVHGNCNEHAGIKKLFKFYNKKRNKLKLLPLYKVFDLPLENNKIKNIMFEEANKRLNDINSKGTKNKIKKKN
jgi:hypothetical protein